MRLHCKFFSTALLRHISVFCEIPYEFTNISSYRSIWALHCAMQGGEFFFENLGGASIAKKNGAVIIAPSLGNNFFINSEHERQADCLEELHEALSKLLPLSTNLQDKAVLGISMGGFGALAWALRSGHFSSAGLISGIFNAAIAPDKRFIHDRNQKMLYGALKKLLAKFLLDQGETGPARQADFSALFANANKLPKISLFCGEEDFLSLPQTLAMFQLAKENQCEVKLDLTQGAHDEPYWAKIFPQAVESLFSD